MHSIKDIVKQLIGKSLDAYNTKYTKVLNTRIDNIVAQAGNDNTEIVDARIDSAGVTHTTLNNRILAETKMNDEQLVEYTGRDISAEDTIQGYLKDVEILGNTIQNEEDLADIKSVGVLQEDGTYKMSILSCGKNLFNPFSSNYEYSLTNGLTKVGHTTNEDGSITVSSKGSYDWGFVEYQNITVPKDITMSFIPNGVVTKGNVSIWIFETNGTKICEGANARISFISTTGKINVRLYVQTTTSYSDAKITYKPYLTEGTVTTPYEPYQGNKCDILLPCQLEKVGDVSDRLYYDDVEKAWCIEKNVKTIKLNGTEQGWFLGGGSKFYEVPINDIQIPNKTIICDKYKHIVASTGDETGKIATVQHKAIRIHPLDMTGLTLEVFKRQLSQDNVLVKYPTTEPQKIVLPLSTQIALNSFFGTTHIYMESGEVEGTIKCKIPKSIGATVQSLNNKTDILSDRIEAIEGLKDSQNMKYETDKGYLVCKETKNGVIDDLKIEGKTLVNYISNFNNWRNMGSTTVSDDGASMTINATAWNKGREISKNLPSGNYIFRVTNPNKATIVVQDKTNARILFNGNEANIDFEFSILEDIELIIVCKNTSETGTYVVSNPILTTDKNFNNYFEGLMSVGQDVDKIEVLSVNENLIEFDSAFTSRVDSWDTANLSSNVTHHVSLNSNLCKVTIENNSNYHFLAFKTIIRKGVSYSYNFDSTSNLGTGVSLFKDLSSTRGQTVTSDFSGTFVANDDYNYIAIPINREVNTYSVSNFILTKDTQVTEYTPHQSDKKQILFYNENGELEPMQELHEWDSIEKHSDNKLHYHKRSGKVVLNGSEDWITTGSADEDTLLFYMEFNAKPCEIYSARKCISDKINSSDIDLGSKNIEGIYTAHDGNICIRISKSKLSTQDVQGFKQWLQANNVTALYQLAKEEVYEIAPLHLDSYANETLILCNSGVISPKMEFSITSHINELIKSQGERINLLEEKVYQYMVTQNRIQLASTYSADSVTFKVDYFSLCGDEENYNEDLYNLILNNILVGKDNYNYDKMFTMILDYASWNQISWEQFDILVGLMDIQHNPPVEEETTEDESIEETPVE